MRDPLKAAGWVFVGMLWAIVILMIVSNSKP